MARKEHYPEGSSYQDILYYQDQFECTDCKEILHISEEVTDYHTGEELCNECMKARIEVQEMEDMFNSPSDYELEQMKIIKVSDRFNSK